MRLVFLTCVVMLAFAANSVLGRAAIGNNLMDATGFGLVRLLSGTAALLLLCQMQRKLIVQPWQQSLAGASALTLYMVGFSLAYKDLDAGLGALVLFGVVQITMFAWGAFSGQRSTSIQLLGAALALIGLAYVVWPKEDVSVDLWASGLMALSGLGWGIYSLLGRGNGDPLVATGMNFLWASVLILPIVYLADGGEVMTLAGVVLAVISGALTSGLGYALWYRVLPQLQPQVAATIQLSVPVIAILAGAAILREPIGFDLILGSVLVLGGIALVVRSPRALASPHTSSNEHAR